MTPEEWRRDEATRWLALAAKDLRMASWAATEEPSGSVFHSQQAAEKSAKALLTLHGVSFRKTHDLEVLGKECAALEPSLAPLFDDAAGLTDYAIVFRYLDAPREPDAAEAAGALAIARQLYDLIDALVAPKGDVEPRGNHE